MCCRLTINKVDPDLAAMILGIGLFVPTYWDPAKKMAVNWVRHIVEDDGREGDVTATISADSFDLNLSPAISTYPQHAGRRIQASVYFSIAGAYAEKINGEVRQLSTVVGCKTGDAPLTLMVASYPTIPISWERI